MNSLLFNEVLKNRSNEIRSNEIRIRRELPVLLFKELFCTAGITKPHEIITYYFLSLCLFLSVCFHSFKGISLEPT